jgi:hypothetical protein
VVPVVDRLGVVDSIPDFVDVCQGTTLDTERHESAIVHGQSETIHLIY